MDSIFSERLQISKVTLDDYQFIQALTNTKGWQKFIGQPELDTTEKAKEFIQTRFRSHYQKHGFGLYKLIETTSNNTVGICGFVQRDYLESPDLGFALLPNFEGNGFVFEAAKKLLAHFELNEIFAITTPKNLSSQLVLEKLNFRFSQLFIPPKSDEQLKLYVLKK